MENQSEFELDFIGYRYNFLIAAPIVLLTFSLIYSKTLRGQGYSLSLLNIFFDETFILSEHERFQKYENDYFLDDKNDEKHHLTKKIENKKVLHFSKILV
jgi:hypothetical protein